jgi:predicted permease
MDTLFLDLRYALRSLKRSPGFAALAILTLGLGIGAATAGFSLLNRLLLQPLPGVRDPGRLAFVTFTQPYTGSFARPGSFTPASPTPEQRPQVVRASPAVLDLAGWQGPIAINVGAPGALAARVEGAFVSGNYLQVLGADAQVGRILISDDDPQPVGTRVAVISDHLWSQLYNRRSDAIGTAIIVNGLPFTLVGVTATGFRGPDRISPADIWVPGNTYWDVQHFPIDGHPPIEIGYYRNVTRLRPGASFEQAGAQLQGAVRALAVTDTAHFTPGVTATLVPGVGMERGGEAVRHELTLIMAVAGLVLLVACANIANLLLFRRAQRRSDIVVRLSLGAAQGRLVRLFLTENALVGLAGGVIGVLVALGLQVVFGNMKVRGFIDVGPVPIDLRVISFAVGLGFVAAVLAGVVPALVGTSVDLNSTLKASGPTQAGSAPRLRLSLATAQVAVSLTLVAGGYLLASTLRNYAQIPLGFEPAGVTVFRTDPREAGYDIPRMRTYYDLMTERIGGLPAIHQVGLVDLPPFTGVSFSLRIRAASESVAVSTLHVSSSYFATLGIPVLRGASFDAADAWPDTLAATKKMILSLSVARAVFGDRDPIGQVVDVPGRTVSFRATVVGVVGDVRNDFIGPVDRLVYQPVGDWPRVYSPSIVVKSSGSDAALAREVRDVARGIDGSVTVENRGALPATVAASINTEHLFFRVIGALSLLTLLLTAVGVYGIVAYGVTTRMREFGIRTALGAVPANLIKVALRPAVTITVLGTLTGVAGALYLTKFIAASLYGVSRFDPWAFATAAGILAAAVLLASWLPARRAAKIDPMVALRYE